MYQAEVLTEGCPENDADWTPVGQPVDEYWRALDLAVYAHSDSPRIRCRRVRRLAPAWHRFLGARFARRYRPLR